MVSTVMGCCEARDWVKMGLLDLLWSSSRELFAETITEDTGGSAETKKGEEGGWDSIRTEEGKLRVN